MDNLHSAALAGVFPNLLPEIMLGAGACLLFLGGTFKSSRHLWGWTALGGLLVSLLACGVTPTYEASPQATFGNPVLFDSLTTLIRVIAIAGGIVLILFGWNEVPASQAADHHAC